MTSDEPSEEEGKGRKRSAETNEQVYPFQKSIAALLMKILGDARKAIQLH